MKCNHCLVSFHASEQRQVIDKDVDGGWAISYAECPSCKKLNIHLLNADFAYRQGSGYTFGAVQSSTLIRPKGINRPPCPPEVPKDIAEDYTEACLVLSDSPKASAALSRRCLQHLLRDKAGIKHGNLDKEIQQVLDAAQLPSYLAESIDAIRQVGNFSAHPMKSQSSNEILPVEPQEAEWNLDTLELLFDFYYVQPALVAAKRAAMNAKLNSAGKPPMK